MDRILLGHGSGGRLMHELVERHFAPAFGITELSDAALCDFPGGGRLAFSTDSYVVSPLIFPGGDIGDMAVNGTVNDLAVSGARPLYMTAGFIIEEGLPFDVLERIVASMARAASEAGVRIVSGDTKVVDRGHGDGIFINTSGVGVVAEGVDLSPRRMEPGDAIIISGPIGRHGIAVMGERNGLSFDPPVLSDTAALNALVAGMMKCAGGDIKVMRDPTRGGLATTLKELAQASGLCMSMTEELLPVPPGVAGACELLGLDPLYVANEGILVAVVRNNVSEYLIEAMRGLPHGRGAALIGRVNASPAGAVALETAFGGTRLVDMLQGQQLPRIC